MKNKKRAYALCGMTPDDKYLVVVELGSDKLFNVKVKKDGVLVERSRLDIRPGSGPRHIVFHPINKKIAYIMTEFSSEVIVLKYEANNGSFMSLNPIKRFQLILLK